MHPFSSAYDVLFTYHFHFFSGDPDEYTALLCNKIPINVTAVVAPLLPFLTGCEDRLKEYIAQFGKDPAACGRFRKLTKVSTIAEVIHHVKLAKMNKKVIRVAGSQHSVTQSIYSDDGVTLYMTGELRRVHFKKIKEDWYGRRYLIVRAGAGVNLGVDPMNPESNEKNSLNYQVQAHGFALPILGSIAHQTIGGFMMTGSAGGSIKYSFDDAIQDIEFVDGNGNRRVAKRGTCLWHAVGVSMGLLGIITHVTFRLEETYLVKGVEVAVPYATSSLRPNQNGLSGLVESLRKYDYFQANWFPMKYVNGVQEYRAKRTKLCPVMTPHVKILTDIRMAVGAAAVTLVADFLLQSPKNNCRCSEECTYQLIGQLFRPFLAFNQTVPFCDTWLSALPNEDFPAINTLFKTYYTQFIFPLHQSKAALSRLEALYQNQTLAGNIANEISGVKRSPFWLSASYGHHAIRINQDFWAYNKGDKHEHFIPFWEQLLALPGGRLHWGKSLPKPGQKIGGLTFNQRFLKQRYPMLKHWLRIRQSVDPYQVFVTKYWRDTLEIR